MVKDYTAAVHSKLSKEKACKDKKNLIKRREREKKIMDRQEMME